MSTSELRHQRARAHTQEAAANAAGQLCEGSFKSVRRDCCRNKHPKEMTSDELLVKLKDNVNTNVATTVVGERKSNSNRMSYLKKSLR